MRFIKEGKVDLTEEIDFDKFMNDILDEEIQKKKILEEGEKEEHSDLRKFLDEKTERPANRIVWRA